MVTLVIGLIVALGLLAILFGVLTDELYATRSKVTQFQDQITFWQERNNQHEQLHLQQSQRIERLRQMLTDTQNQHVTQIVELMDELKAAKQAKQDSRSEVFRRTMSNTKPAKPAKSSKRPKPAKS